MLQTTRLVLLCLDRDMVMGKTEKLGECTTRTITARVDDDATT